MTTAPATTLGLITGEELLRMPNTDWCELVEGRIVRMTPPGDEHGEVQVAVIGILMDFVRPQKLGKVRGEVGVYTRRNPDNVRAPDALFISNERYAQKRTPGYLEIAPDLVVEILSPGNSMSEMKQKLREYFAIGVKLVWIIDPPAGTVSAYRSLSDVREFTSSDELPGDDVLPGFLVPVASLFED